VALLLAAAGSASQRGASAQLQEAERARTAQLQAQQAAAGRLDAARAEERRLAGMRVAAAASLRLREEATAELAGKVADLAERTRAAQNRLAARARDLVPMLPLIERLSLYPSETLLAVPLPSEQALRGVLVLGFMARRLESEAASLKREQAEIATLRGQLDATAQLLATAQAAQAGEAAALDGQIAAARDQERQAEDAASEAARRGAVEAGRADGLRAAIARIEAERQDAERRARADAALATRQRRDGDAAQARDRQEALARPAGPGVATATITTASVGGQIGPQGGSKTGRLAAPVAGPVVRGFGEAGDGGPASGLSYQAPPAARVVSPCGGRIVFSGPFRSFGQLMIVDCGAGDMLVLAGLDRLDAHVGQAVQPGEPVGVMPNWDPRSGGARPSLYVELRHGGQAVNPAPFLRAKG
jgi:septal ring factor EnvC (AmiA/AmiB activator)